MNLGAHAPEGAEVSCRHRGTDLSAVSRPGHEALSRRRGCYGRSGQDQRAIRDYDEAIRILFLVQDTEPQDAGRGNSTTIAPSPMTTAPRPISAWASRRKACWRPRRLCSSLRESLIFMLSVAVQNSRSVTSKRRFATTIRQWRLVARAGSSIIRPQPRICAPRDRKREESELAPCLDPRRGVLIRRVGVVAPSWTRW
jgi:hypothetical protein